MLIGFQLRLENPNDDWAVINAGFVKQKDVMTDFDQRKLVHPDETATEALNEYT